MRMANHARRREGDVGDGYAERYNTSNNRYINRNHRYRNGSLCNCSHQEVNAMSISDTLGCMIIGAVLGLTLIYLYVPIINAISEWKEKRWRNRR